MGACAVRAHPELGRRITLALLNNDASASVRHVSGTIAAALGADHEVLQWHASGGRECDELEAAALVRSSDVLVGVTSQLPPLLKAREALDSKIPCVVFLLGTLPRGALRLRDAMQYLRSNDILVVNCSVDEVLAREFLPDARVEVIPLAIDERAFSPVTTGERDEARLALGFSASSRVMLYAGRIAVEKNVHTTLRVFATLQWLIPDLHLLLAGPFENWPFAEVACTPVNYARSLAKAIERLGIPEDRVSHLGVLEGDDLRSAYGAADLFVNLTLHHDENFGLGQVEAMACGTPVVGTAWGGLHDTIRAGVTGHKVSTVVTPIGVKVDWWEATNVIWRYLAPKEPLRRVTPAEVPMNRYSLAHLRNVLNAVIAGARAEAAAPMRPSEFAEQCWLAWAPEGAGRASFARDEYAFQRYLRLIAHYAGTTQEYLYSETPFHGADVLSLLVPVFLPDVRTIEVLDPLFPTSLTLPTAVSANVRLILGTMTRRPVITVDQLCAETGRRLRYLAPALNWMLEGGLILRARSMGESIAPENVGEAVGRPLFAIRSVDLDETDFLVMRH